MGIKLIASLALFTVLISCGQSKIVSVQLAKPEGSKYQFAQVEPSIAIHPKNTNIQIAGSVLDDYYYSQDAGKTWTSKTLKSKYGVYGDPVLLFDNEGRAYYFHLASYKQGHHLDRIVCQYSDKVDGEFSGGSAPAPVGTKVQDKHWICVDPETNALYMTWTQFDAYNSDNPKDSSIIVFSKSLDQGVSWSTPIRISKHGGDCLDDDNTVEGAVPAVGKNGEIFVAWAGPLGLVWQKSLDKGETWMKEEIVIGPLFGGWTLEIPAIMRANGLPILQSDLSQGPNRGTLYLNWCDQKNGEDDTDVWLAKSTDEGQTWSAPIRVNQDKGKAQQFFTWMTVDQSTGYLYLVYYDRRNSKGNETDVYAACSKDGGQTFTEVRITEKPFLSDESVFFGDYLNIAAVDGVVRAIYPRMDEFKISLWVGLLSERGFK
jgi:hypothetical protein|tara:strand:+ start:87735 stop:89024 length:1290 start_codon:yes stop_codon:yes gene_type:complete